MLLRRAVVILCVCAMVVTLGGYARVQAARNLRLHGYVESNGIGLDSYNVSLYASYVTPPRKIKVLATAVTDSSGQFQFDYKMPSKRPAVVYVVATSGKSMLASAISDGPVTGAIFITERTTVATGFAFAQFVTAQGLDGNRYGMLNALHMAANMANPQTGRVADVLALPPNGPETEALATFNSLANIVAGCVQASSGCDDLFAAATVAGETAPQNVLEAVADIAKYPWSNAALLYDLSTNNLIFLPSLSSAPHAWTIFLKVTGSSSSEQDKTNLLNGPGNIAIDKQGYLWVNDNYTPAKPSDAACPGDRLLKYYPWGQGFSGSPYFGGGLSGAGFGIAIAPNHRIWVGNFGFNGVGCPVASTADSVSLFNPNGKPISPDTGYTAGPLSWPMSTVSNRRGDIWISDCETDSVTIYPKGKTRRAFEVPFPTGDTSGSGGPVAKPFGIAFDSMGHAWVAGTLNSTMAVYGRNGKLLQLIPPASPNSAIQLRRPVGVASDPEGNIWVADSDYLDPPCPPGSIDFGPATNPGITLFRPSSADPYTGTFYTGGGVTLPWGIAVDGNGTVWVANFGFPFDPGDPGSAQWPAENRVSNFCGVETSNCPPGKQSVGASISPDGYGYETAALDRNTGLAIDPSGNVWLANNWKQKPLLNNPGGNAIVVLVGVAGPVKTPLIGTPKSFTVHSAK